MKRLTKKYPLNRSQSALTLIVLAILLSVHFVWAETKNFQKMVKEFQQSAISDFIEFNLKGERYPLMHTISELRFRVFTEELGINRKTETKACSRRRAYGIEVPQDQEKFCKDYDALVELAKRSISNATFFEKIYLNSEPALLHEIERQRARDSIRIWIRQKLNCLKDKFRCGRDEGKLINRLTNFNRDILNTYIHLLQNLEKKLFPEEQVASKIEKKDLETLCGFIEDGDKNIELPGMVLIKPEKFKMGSDEGLPSERPIHQVKLDQFWIDKCEITNYQYLQVVAQHPFLRKSTFPRKYHDGNYLRNWKDDLMPELRSELKPVTNVSWYAARHYCNFIGKRLASEAEWEMAARAGGKEKYSFDGGIEFLPDYGWFRENSGGMIHTTAQKLSNPNGLFDIHGNAWEWVFDWFSVYNSDNVSNPQGPEMGKYRVMRGGSWSDPAEYLRSAMRRDALPTSTFNNVGFRCATE